MLRHIIYASSAVLLDGIVSLLHTTAEWPRNGYFQSVNQAQTVRWNLLCTKNADYELFKFYQGALSGYPLLVLAAGWYLRTTQHTNTQVIYIPHLLMFTGAVGYSLLSGAGGKLSIFS
jgi:hypothetical protein